MKEFIYFYYDIIFYYSKYLKFYHLFINSIWLFLNYILNSKKYKNIFHFFNYYLLIKLSII